MTVTEDEIARYNRVRWEALAQHHGLFTRPFVDFTHLEEETQPIEGTQPGQWPHLVALMPPWFTLWTRLRAGCG